MSKLSGWGFLEVPDQYINTNPVKPLHGAGEQLCALEISRSLAQVLFYFAWE